jgi:hypothetical protein
VSPAHRHELLVFHFVVIGPPAPPPPMAGMAPLLDVDQRDLQRQAAMGEHAGEMDQIVEQADEAVRDRYVLAVAEIDPSSTRPKRAFPFERFGQVNSMKEGKFTCEQ